MKVLFITPYTGSAYGGIAKVVIELVAALAKAGLQVDLITTNADVSGKLQVPLNCWIQEQGYRVQYFSCWHKNDFIFSRKLLWWLYQHIGDYSLVHTHTVFCPLISCCHWICRFKGMPYIVTPHGMLEPWAMSYKSHKKRAYFEFIETPNLLKAAFVQGTASVEANNIASLLPGLNVVCVPNGLERTEFLSNDKNSDALTSKYPHLKGKKIILFLGRIDPKKGLDLLAPAFAKAYRRFPDIHLVVAGPDNIGFQPTAEIYFLEAGIADAVTFTGMLQGDLKQSALEVASIYVAPSYSEGFSMSILEGMAAGLPCIITNSCNFPEAADAQAAKIVPPKAEDLFVALNELLEHPEDAARMGEHARRLVAENYTWEEIAQKLMQIYGAFAKKSQNKENLLHMP